MNITLLGSGEALGVPAPLCNCEYCGTSSERRRPGLLVETDQATAVFDVSPDITEQLHTTGTIDVDAFFVTHHHYDHVGGLHELNHAAMEFEEHMLNSDEFTSDEKPRSASFDLHLGPIAQLHLSYSNAHIADRLEPKLLMHGHPVHIGDVTVVPFPVNHARPMFDTLGFAIYQGNKKVVYAPDMWEFMDDPEYTDADLLFAEGAALFRAFGHGEQGDLHSALVRADAERTILVNLSEHIQRMTTDEMRIAATQYGYELGKDFAEYWLC